jgi:xylan 1,4-beta-xylosidase
MKWPIAFALTAALSLATPAVASQTGAAKPALSAERTDSFPVKVRVDAGRDLGELPPIWRDFGADEPNYGHMKHGRALLAELGKLRTSDVFFRTHNLLDSGDGTPALKWGSTNAYSEDAAGRPVYDWTILDRLFDGYLELKAAGAGRPRPGSGHAPPDPPAPGGVAARPGMEQPSLTRILGEPGVGF